MLEGVVEIILQDKYRMNMIVDVDFLEGYKQKIYDEYQIMSMNILGNECLIK